MKTLLLLSSLITFSSLGEILSSKGMKQVGRVSFNLRALLGTGWRMIRNPYLACAVTSMALAFFSFISLLSYADLSFVLPLTSVTYVTNTLGARFLLKERVSRERWLGTLLVTGGVSLVSLSDRIESILNLAAGEWVHRLYLLLGPAEIISRSHSPIAFWLVWSLRFLLLICVSAAISYSLFSLFACFSWFLDRRRQRALGVDYTPPVTIFKPVSGADPEAYENFASFCRQDYPDYQIIFGVRAEDDPAVAIIRRLIADLPGRRIELVVSQNENGYNGKISNLQNMYAHARHEILLLADSDIRVGTDYLRRVIAPLQRQQVGMVTCLYRGARARSFAGILENIGISSIFGPDVCSARALEGIAFAFGSTIAMRRELLERIGGFKALADYLADDFLLGQRAAKAGYEVVLSDYVVEHITTTETMASMLKHQLRWARTIRISRSRSYCGLIFTFGTATSLLALVAWNFASFAWWLFAIALLARLLAVFGIGVFGLKDYALVRWFWLVPLRDLIAFAVWIISFTGDEVEWRGMNFRVRSDGKLIPSGKA